MLAKTLQAGAPLDVARIAVALVHGRGASGASMLEFARQLVPPGSPEDWTVAYIAPQAPGSSWYPHSFLSPIERNEPHLSNSLRTLEELLKALDEAGLPPERVMLLGFSQGACLALEFAARNPRRYGGIVGLSGGLIGPPGLQRSYSGSFDNTPVFLGCSDVDPHIPLARVQESAQALERMQAQVQARIYPGMGHTVNEDEMEMAAKMIERLLR